jgi:hypothetical protein
VRIKQIGETLAEILTDAERRGVTPLEEAKHRAERALGRARELSHPPRPAAASLVSVGSEE